MIQTYDSNTLSNIKPKFATGNAATKNIVTVLYRRSEN